MNTSNLYDINDVASPTREHHLSDRQRLHDGGINDRPVIRKIKPRRSSSLPIVEKRASESSIK